MFTVHAHGNKNYNTTAFQREVIVTNITNIETLLYFIVFSQKGKNRSGTKALSYY
jgi:hypothetical protein